MFLFRVSTEQKRWLYRTTLKHFAMFALIDYIICSALFRFVLWIWIVGRWNNGFVQDHCNYESLFVLYFTVCIKLITEIDS